MGGNPSHSFLRAGRFVELHSNRQIRFGAIIDSTVMIITWKIGNGGAGGGEGRQGISWPGMAMTNPSLVGRDRSSGPRHLDCHLKRVPPDLMDYCHNLHEKKIHL